MQAGAYLDEVLEGPGVQLADVEGLAQYLSTKLYWQITCAHVPYQLKASTYRLEVAEDCRVIPRQQHVHIRACRHIERQVVQLSALLVRIW